MMSEIGNVHTLLYGTSLLQNTSIITSSSSDPLIVGQQYGIKCRPGGLFTPEDQKKYREKQMGRALGPDVYPTPGKQETEKGLV